MGIIKNAKDTPLNVQTGTIPNVGGALLNWLQPMTFGIVTKQTINFEVVETEVDVNFLGVMQPFTERQLFLKPEGQRAWSWFWLHAEPQLDLKVDQIIKYLGIQTRVMAKKNYTIYGYIEYHLVQDWTGSGPELTT